MHHLKFLQTLLETCGSDQLSSGCNCAHLYRGSYISARVFLNLLNEFGKSDKIRGLPSIFSLPSLINSVIQEL